MLEGMQIFSLPAHLINISKPQAVISILLRFFNVATLIGEPFSRCVNGIKVLKRYKSSKLCNAMCEGAPCV